MTWYFLRLEIVRALRDPRYLALAVATPIGFYLLFATLFGGAPVRPGELRGTVEIMVAMAAYGAIWAVLSTTGPRIAQEREIGWLEQLRAMPVRAWQVLAAKLVAGGAMALPAICSVCLVAALAKGVRLGPGQWAGLVVAMWLGTAAFAALGVAIGYAVNADASYVVCYGLYMVTSAVGGLWVPPGMLPESFRSVSGWLPSNRLADLGWQIAGGHPALWPAIGVLAAWTAGLAVVAVLIYRRPRLRRSRPPGGTAHLNGQNEEARAGEARAGRAGARTAVRADG
ncbi:ABC transporter permease [Planotetraspora sp. A-T 1434]|uniref:ABC transporter permease n=1 Tax=Planotetraspora sp. A-T 1434 TaxID=2979219 RepID=UPI0021BE7B2A|nr:ABC transporter permease [Planotetraspora sp. A-T 1434]MCT9933245.1 ABC transporter permease [Planotetraspora sp. A-T 1434]